MSKGRPSDFTQEIADKICAALCEGMTLREVCRQEWAPPRTTVLQWVVDDREGFSDQYTRAREAGYHEMADELLEIADDAQNDWMLRNSEKNEGWEANGEHMQRSRLRVDTRKWMLSKALPKVYGDKLAIGGDRDMDPIKTEEIGGLAKLKARLSE